MNLLTARERPDPICAPDPHDVEAMLDQVLRDVMDLLDRIHAQIETNTPSPNQSGA